jgi:threonine/homoserine/homoserine lactone efflux protein
MPVSVSQVMAFGVAVAPIIVTPGTGFAMFSTTMAARGPRGAKPLVVGMLTGMGVVATIILVLYPLLAGRRGVVGSIAVVGGLYLVGMGCRDLWRLMTGRIKALVPAEQSTGAVVHEDARARFTEGALTSMTNPGLFIIYLVVVPTFIPGTAAPRAQFAVLSAEHIAMSATWWSGLLVAFGSLRRFISSPRRQAAIVVCASVALVIIGVSSIMSGVAPRP